MQNAYKIHILRENLEEAICLLAEVRNLAERIELFESRISTELTPTVMNPSGGQGNAGNVPYQTGGSGI